MASDARQFLANHRHELERIPVAVFAMGPLELDADDIAGSRRQLDRALATEHEVEPMSVTIFGGVIDPAKLRFPLNRCMEAADARAWDAIRSWAEEISGLLAGRAAA